MSDLSFTKKDGYDLIQLKGCQMSRDIGAPTLPLKTINLIIPSGTEAASVVINSKNSQIIPGNFRIYPVQSPIKTSSEGFNVSGFIPPDSTIYNSNLSYPANNIKIVNTSTFDGSVKMVQLQICPFSYEPASKELSMYTNISFTIGLKPSVDSTIQIKRRSSKAQITYNQILNALVDNPEVISTYQRLPDSVFTDNPKVGISTNVIQPNLAHPPYPIAAPYIIITSASLKDAFNNFVAQKAADGITVNVIYTDQIYYWYTQGDKISSPAIVDNAGCIRQFLKYAWTNGCTWVLLGGDNTIVPCRYDPLYNCPADWYYSDLIGNWNPNGSLSISYSPTVNVGRLPFNNQQDIINWTNKVIQYETNPFPGNPSAVTKVLYSASDQMEDDGLPGIMMSLFPANFTQKVIQELPSGGDLNPTYPTGAQIISELNKGYGIYNIYSHGDPTVYSVRTPGVNAGNGTNRYCILSYDNYPCNYVVEPGNGIDNTTNNCTIAWSLSCQVANYDQTVPAGEDCIAKAWLRVNGGGPAFLGFVRDSYSSQLGLEIYFLSALFNFNIIQLGPAEGYSKYAYGDPYSLMVHNLFGDPAMVMHTSIPSPKIAISQNQKESVSVSENFPKEFGLAQNYPNPFNPSTKIQVALPVISHVILKIYDVLGREILTLVDGLYGAGYHEFNFNGSKLSSGIYYYKLTAGNYVSTKKMLIVK
jgi:hypothetical protein